MTSGFVADASATLPSLVYRSYEWADMAVRRSRIDLDRVARFARDLAALPIRIAPAAWDAVIRVATKHQLTVYDAAYLELAERTRLPLATLDGDLRKAAMAESVALVEA